MDKNPKWEITNGNHRARGWEQTPEGNWVPSLHDRRRVTTAALGLVAENYGGMIPGPAVAAMVRLNSTSREDGARLTEMVMRQLTAQ